MPDVFRVIEGNLKKIKEPPRVAEILTSGRDDGWEQVELTIQEQCFGCGKWIKFGWLEMEADVVDCDDCVPPVREPAAAPSAAPGVEE